MLSCVSYHGLKAQKVWLVKVQQSLRKRHFFGDSPLVKITSGCFSQVISVNRNLDGNIRKCDRCPVDFKLGSSWHLFQMLKLDLDIWIRDSKSGLQSNWDTRESDVKQVFALCHPSLKWICIYRLKFDVKFVPFWINYKRKKCLVLQQLSDRLYWTRACHIHLNVPPPPPPPTHTQPVGLSPRMNYAWVKSVPFLVLQKKS